MSKKEESEKRNTIRISVRNLVEFIFREGDIDNRKRVGTSPDAMQEGSRIHRKIQKRMDTSYHAEVPLKFIVTEETYDLAIEGRADGIIIEENTSAADNYLNMEIPDSVRVTIDEIKGVYMRLDALQEPIGVHKAQALCYAYIYATQHHLKRIDIQMTYCNLDTEDIKRFRETWEYDDLETW